MADGQSHGLYCRDLNTGVKKDLMMEKPPKHAAKKTEYVKQMGTGHEASGANDDGNNGKKEKDDHGGGSGSGGGGGSGHPKVVEGDIYCPECKKKFSKKKFEKHYCYKEM